ncbi:hypothetical protein KSE_64990 [Kitasatospora setae KM-6054]|uniref:Uncharacterized protein n=1 Tax=Kitasatospora setae (strain ATCC 33774 / DSM 43861 / JCM 3304 / KCC A-0304 / NBRC 14216 / KM-6054) TaxID=452652 RepID=E4N275_KITSK|nr:hypothetical protein KSE_64990 [Kitasatospora setae KM-6054]
MAGVAVSCLVVPSAQAAEAAPAPASRGAAALYGWVGLSPQSAPLPGYGDLTLSVDAHAQGRSGGTGRAVIQHKFSTPQGGWEGTVRVEVDVDCLVADGDIAAVTGTVRSLAYTVPPGTAEPLGPPDGWHPEVGFSFSLDRTRQGRVGWSGVPDSSDPTAPPVIAKCEAPTPDLYVIEGGYRLRR